MAIFPEEILDVDPSQKMREEDTWINYFLAGYKAVMTSPEVEEIINKGHEPVGMKIFIDSKIPTESGLSPSKAFIVSVIGLVIHANGFVDKLEVDKIREFIEKAEKLIGRENKSLESFHTHNPKVTEESKNDTKERIIPEGYSLVISNSLTPISRFASQNSRSFMREVELRIATILLSMEYDKEYDVINPQSCPYKTLKELQLANKFTNEDMIDFINSKLKKGK